MVKRKQIPKYHGKHPRTKAQKAGKMHTVMGEYKRGQLTTHGRPVTDRKQALAIGLSYTKGKKGKKRKYKRSGGK